VPSATDNESKNESAEDSSEGESDEAEKTFRTITEAAEGDEESMLVGDKSMMALMSAKSNVSNKIEKKNE
jgi:hypothetical protein